MKTLKVLAVALVATFTVTAASAQIHRRHVIVRHHHVVHHHRPVVVVHHR
jgi:hypothetical protein